MDPDPLASAETITLLRRFSAVVDTNRIFGHYDVLDSVMRLATRPLARIQIEHKILID